MKEISSCGECEFLTDDYVCLKSESRLSVLKDGESLLTEMVRVRNHVVEWCPLKNQWDKKTIDDLTEELTDRLEQNT